MNILSFSYCFPSGVGATWGVFVLQRVAAMARREGVRLEAVGPVPVLPVVTRLLRKLPARREQINGLTVHHPRFAYLPGPFQNAHGRMYARGLRRWLGEQVQRSRPDVLDAHFVWPDGVGVSLLAREMGLPYTITLRGKLYPCLENESQRGQCADALRKAAAVISVSRPMLEEAAKLGVAAERLHLIPNGVDLDMFQSRDRAEAREALGLPADGRILVTVAHLGLRKGSRETIRAMSALPNDVHLVLVGQDSRGGKDTREIRALAQQFGVGGRVIVAGRQPYEKIGQYYAAADAGVLASYREGCPNAVLECLACGRPVVASRVGAVPDLVRDGVDGRVMEPRDDQALASALADVLDRHWDPAVVSGGPAVRSWDAVAAEVLRVFSQSGIGTSEE